MPTAKPTLTLPPAYPSLGDSANFDTRAEARLAWEDTAWPLLQQAVEFVDEKLTGTQAQASAANTSAAAAATSAAAAATSQGTASSAATTATSAATAAATDSAAATASASSSATSATEANTSAVAAAAARNTSVAAAAASASAGALVKVQDFEVAAGSAYVDITLDRTIYAGMQVVLTGVYRTGGIGSTALTLQFLADGAPLSASTFTAYRLDPLATWYLPSSLVLSRLGTTAAAASSVALDIQFGPAGLTQSFYASIIGMDAVQSSVSQTFVGYREVLASGGTISAGVRLMPSGGGTLTAGHITVYGLKK